MKMLKTCLVAVALLFAITPTWAAESVSIFTDTIQNTTSTGNGSTLDVEHFSSLGLKVTISSTATVTFKVSTDGVGAYSDLTCTLIGDITGAPVISTTTSGEYQCNVAGMGKIQTPVTANTGTVTVFARATTGVLGKGGGGGGLGVGGSELVATATAAVPSAAEGDPVTLSSDLRKVLRATLADLLFCEDSDNNLCMVSGGKVRITQLVGTGGVPSTASDATTLANILPVGIKTFQALETCTGTCTQTLKIYGASESSATVAKGILVCTIALSATATATDYCSTDRNFIYWFVVTSGTGGTTPLSGLFAMY